MRAVAEHTDRTLRGADQAARFVRASWLDRPGTLDLPARLDDGGAIDPMYHLVTVVGADGHVRASTQGLAPTVDLSDREHFRVHREGRLGGDHPFVSKPVLGRVSGLWSIQLSRRIEAPDGRFDGMVVVSLSPRYFTEFFEAADLGAHGVTTLLGSEDGVVRARASAASQGVLDAMGQNLSSTELFRRMARQPAGLLRAVSPVDWIERIHAYATLPEWKLTVLVGMEVREIERDAFEQAQRLGAALALVTLLLVVSATLVGRQVRARERVMAALEHARQQADAASALKSRFIASVSHELRTPLNGILGYAELIREDAPDETIRQYGHTVHHSALHLLSLVNSLLDLARIEAGRMPVHPEPFVPAELLGETVRLHAVSAAAQGAALDLRIRGDARRTVQADRTKLLQVLNNVVGNAVKFGDGGPVRVRAVAGARALRIRVTDRGAGIPPEVIERVFERFHGADGPMRHARQGAGLGLPLARELVELMGGRLTIASRVGAGTTVRLHVPVRSPEDASR